MRYVAYQIMISYCKELILCVQLYASKDCMFASK